MIYFYCRIPQYTRITKLIHASKAQGPWDLLESKATITGAQPLARRETGWRTWFLVSFGWFFNMKELWQSTSTTLTLLIDYKMKYTRPNRRPARSARGLAGGLANIFFPSFGYFPVRKCFSVLSHTCVGSQRILGDIHFEGPNGLKFSPLSNNPDFWVIGAWT